MKIKYESLTIENGMPCLTNTVSRNSEQESDIYMTFENRCNLI